MTLGNKLLTSESGHTQLSAFKAHEHSLPLDLHAPKLEESNSQSSMWS